MTITVKDVIKAELLRVCLETTTKFRTKHEKKEKKEKFTPEEVQKVRDMYAKFGYNSDQITLALEVHSILHDAPELKRPTVPVMDLFCVVVCEKDVNGHGQGTAPFIWTKKRDPSSGFFMTHSGGEAGGYFYYGSDQARFATDDEVKTCIDNLTDKQWATVRSHALFAPVMDSAMAKAVQVEDEPGENKEEDNGEITVYGRSITVTDE